MRGASIDYETTNAPADLENAVPLCAFHHRRVHDDRYTVETTPDGYLRFTHRWPSRQRRRREILAA